MKYTIAAIIALVGQTCTAAPVSARLPLKGMSMASDLSVGWEDGTTKSQHGLVQIPKINFANVKNANAIRSLGRRDQAWEDRHSQLLDYGDQLWADMERATAQLSKECYDKYEIESDVNDCEDTEFTKVYYQYARLNQDLEWKLNGGSGSGTVDLHMPKGPSGGGVILNWKRDSEEWKAKQEEYEKEEDRLQAAEDQEKKRIHDDLVVGKFNTDTYGDLKDDIEEKYDALQDELNFLQRGGAHPKSG